MVLTPACTWLSPQLRDGGQGPDLPHHRQARLRLLRLPGWRCYVRRVPSDNGAPDRSSPAKQDYQWNAPGSAPTFDHITLAGQSNGGQIVQIEAFTFNDIDALVVMDWADRGLTPEAYVRFFATTARCLAGGSPSERNTEVSGYTFYDQGRTEFVTGNYTDTEQHVIDAAAPFQNQHPCGDMLSQGPAIAVDLLNLSKITIPILGLNGDDDARVQYGTEHIRSFTGTPDKYSVTVPNAGHYMGHAKDYVLEHARQYGQRLSVFSGCIFASDDPVYRGVAIPRRFFKIAAWQQDVAFAATGYVLDQTQSLGPILERPARADTATPPLGPCRTFQVPIEDIADATGLSIDRLVTADRYALQSAARLEQQRWTELSSYADIVV